MPEPGDELSQLSDQLHASHGATPTHIEVPELLKGPVDELSQHPTMTENPGLIELMKIRPIGEVIDDTGEDLSPTKIIPLTPHKPIAIRGELQPFAERSLDMYGSHQVVGDIVASVTYDEHGGRYELIRDVKGQYGLVEIDGDGKVLKTDIMDNYRGVISSLHGVFVAEHTTYDDEYKWILDYKSYTENKTPVVDLKVAESIETKDRVAIVEEQFSKERHKVRMKWLKRLVGAAAIVTTLAPGGLIDQVADPFVSSEQTIQTAIDTFQPPNAYTLDSEIDGTPIKDMDNPEAVLAEHNAWFDERWESAQESGAAVEQTMNNLDNHDYQAILDRAAEYREVHASEFMNASEVAAAIVALESAQTKEEVIAALSPIQQFYGYEFVVSDAVSLDAFKNTSRQIVEALVILPESFTARATSLNTIRFATTEEINLAIPHPGASTQGYYTGSSIVVTSNDVVSSTVKDVLATIPGSQSGFDIKSLFLHEFGHALSANAVGVSDQDRVGGAESPVNIAQDILFGGIFQSPQVISTYARSNWEESKAENTSGILSSRDDGLAHPDEARKFTSPANQTMLQGLISFDMLDPGFANYIVSQNERLMRGQTLGL